MANYTQGVPTPSNVICVAGDLYTSGAPDVFLGATQGETELAPERKFNLIDCEQVAGAIGASLIDEALVVKGNLLEATLANLGKVTGSATGFGSNTFTIDAFKIKSQGIGSTTRTFTIHKGIMGTGTSYKCSKTKETLIPFEIICIKDLTKSQGEQFYSVAEA